MRLPCTTLPRARSRAGTSSGALRRRVAGLLAAAVLAALAGCPRSAARPGTTPHETTIPGPSTAAEHRAWLLLEDRCLVELGPPCTWSGELREGALALADVLRREGQEALRREPLVRAALQGAGIGHPGTMAAALFYSTPQPSDADLDAFIAGLRWPFPARVFGVVEAAGGGAAAVPGSGAAAAGMLVVVAAEPLVEMEPLPRWLPQEADVTFQGRTVQTASQLRVMLAEPSGAIRELPVEEGDDGVFRGAVHVGPALGRYVFELVAERTAWGPQVLYLLPIDLSLEPPEPSPGPGSAPAGETTEPGAAEARMLELVTALRDANGLGPLRRDTLLDLVARDHAADMAEHGFFGHASPTRGDLDARLRAQGVTYPRAAENLAVGPSAEAAFANLVESPAHRANFLEPSFSRVGVAAVQGDGSLLFAVELAGDR